MVFLRSRRGAYSLVELVAAMGVFTVALVAFFSVAQHKGRAIGWASEQEAALRAAENAMAGLRLLPREALLARSGSRFAVPEVSLQGGEAGSILVAPGPEEGVLHATVTVTWTTVRSATRKVALETWIRK